MKPVPFDKLHARGNDFVIVDRAGLPGCLAPRQVAALADRHTGIGFDQLLLVNSASDPVRVQIRNADGSPGMQCINGMHAVALWLERRGLLRPDTQLRTPAGVISVRPESAGHRARQAAAGFAGRYHAELDLPRVVARLAPFSVDGREFDEAWAVDAGNPHLLVASPEPLADRARYGAALAAPAAGWQAALDAGFREHCRAGCNAGFARIERDFAELAVWERGSGATRACGSAACALAAVVMREPAISRLTVAQPGGRLILEQCGERRLRVTGRACHVFSGRVHWPAAGRMMGDAKTDKEKPAHQ